MNWNRLTSWAVCVVVACVVIGCPPAVKPPEDLVNLNVSLAGGELKVGSKASFSVGFEATEGALFSAMLADESQAQLTHWHCEPAGAVQFEQNEGALRQVGPVTVWASWQDGSGKTYESNRLTLQVTPSAWVSQAQ